LTSVTKLELALLAKLVESSTLEGSSSFFQREIPLSTVNKDADAVQTACTVDDYQISL
jgi:hypothetical protein